MRSKLVFALVAIAAIGLILISRGRSERKDSAATKVETADSAAAGDKSQLTEFSLSANDDEGYDLPEREEIRQKRKLTPGVEVYVAGVKDFGADTDHTQVFVIGVNGKVKVETADTDAAEILVVRSARKREDLQRNEVEISNDEDLFIRIGGGEGLDQVHQVRKRLLRVAKRFPKTSSPPDPAPEIRRRVILRLPRKTGLEIREIGGDVTVAEIGGYLKIAEVTGNVRATGVAGPIVVGGNVNGPVDIAFAPLTGASIKIYGDINGDVDLRFEGEVNADLNTSGVNGAINPDLQNVVTRESEPVWGKLKARIGKGGTVIEIYEVNGNVTLSKAANREGRR